ncbi:MAG: cytochrome c [Rhodobacteraceae bacterium]|nr:cytochrome c [Paracoccaceae bacterium]
MKSNFRTALAFVLLAQPGLAQEATPQAVALQDAAAQAVSPHDMGRLLFETNCVACHGADANEGKSGDIRDVDFRTVRKATGGGYEDMPEFSLTDAEMQAIVSYLNALKS